MKQKTEKYEVNIEYIKIKFGQKLYCFLKGIFERLVALIMLILLSPLFIITAIAIKVDSKGPVFFKQPRVGKKGKMFKCIKFRSMSMDARHDVAGYEYAEARSYITKVGKFIRKTSIDELPQLFNVLFGQMGLIGYRPSQDNETELNTTREQFGLYQIKPGVTGWAQINGRDVLASHPTLKAKYDAYYLRRVSLFFDIKILFLTVIKVLKSSDVEEGTIKDTENAEQTK